MSQKTQEPKIPVPSPPKFTGLPYKHPTRLVRLLPARCLDTDGLFHSACNNSLVGDDDQFIPANLAQLDIASSTASTGLSDRQTLPKHYIIPRLLGPFALPCHDLLVCLSLPAILPFPIIAHFRCLARVFRPPHPASAATSSRVSYLRLCLSCLIYYLTRRPSIFFLINFSSSAFLVLAFVFCYTCHQRTPGIQHQLPMSDVEQRDHHSATSRPFDTST
ncbi:hypothetical protein GGS21DRAFT_458390 [Xylaria nigripes]|nr:hypothetical protein GGS21DRAFT_458390 [Xylaria nigripes]